jgi:carbonic anhydrase
MGRCRQAWEGAGKDVTWKDCLGAVNTENLLPSARTNLQYDGSLTTPFCAQGVKWVVYTTPVKVSQKVFEAIKNRTPNPNTARPLQALGTRVIK